jgi:Undecaprenyl-phosphate galactose phosphotransferase WbaP
VSLVCLTFLLKAGAQYSRGATILAWATAVALVPITRLISRPLLGKYGWFAKPVAILGAGRTGQMLVELLKRNPGLALNPLVAFDDDPAKQGRLLDVPVVSRLDEAPAYCKTLGIDYAIIAMPGLTRKDLLAVMRRAAAGFSQRLLVPDLFGVSSVWVEARDLGGVLGLEIRDNLLRPSASAAKRVLDLVFVLSSLPVVLPLFALIALLVKLTSRGAALYGQKRIGRHGKTITVWKFRTMVADADAALQRHLASNPHLRAEWLRDHKLRKDPRITALGRFLRRASLDELPQLWNVLTGELSLVGPRPIVAEEIEKFGGSYECYTRVLPGLTGPWQVSGRNDLEYDERVRLNEYYVRNWSVWLDLYILLRTVRVVLTGQGSC